MMMMMMMMMTKEATAQDLDLQDNKRVDIKSDTN
uniref:Uncharacterized protein n=1 Tax=Anguilla anguilla TaxID=7936 RepID=A0A0E9SDG8_ANGAN